jgi:hypothetical protein
MMYNTTLITLLGSQSQQPTSYGRPTQTTHDVRGLNIEFDKININKNSSQKLVHKCIYDDDKGLRKKTKFQQEKVRQ